MNYRIRVEGRGVSEKGMNQQGMDHKGSHHQGPDYQVPDHQQCVDNTDSIAAANANDDENADPKVFGRLARRMMRYLSDKNVQLDQELNDAKRKRLAAEHENEELLACMTGLEAEVFQQSTECQSAKNVVAALEADIAKLKSSRSWKLTKPLRRLRRIT